MELPKRMRENSTDYKHQPRKRFGQNFLIDGSIVDKIIEAADVQDTDTVLEIGPGKGALTRLLQKRAKRLVIVEIDKDLVRLLKDMFSGEENITIIEGDFLKLDIEALFTEKENVKVVANLPYYITTPIMMKLFESEVSFERLVVMVQREVALRMCAKPGTKDYGALTLAVDFYTKPHIVTEVLPNCFRPAPKVSSSVVALDKTKEICEGKEKEYLFKIIKLSFAQRRKTLINALSSIIVKDELKEILLELGLKENIRGEILSLNEFNEISKKIGEKNGY